MKMNKALCAVFALGALAGFAAPAFQTALPVWPEGRATRMNDFVEFRASFDAKAGEKPILRVTGSSVYRIRLTAYTISGAVMGLAGALLANHIING